MKRIILLIVILLGGFLYGQSDEVLDELYEEDDAKTLITSLLVLQASSHLTFNSTVDDAREYLETTKWGKSILKDGVYITKGSFSLMVMEVFDLPHGIMYGFFPTKRYALREMVFSEYMLGNPYTNDIMSSFDVINILSTLDVDSEINKNYIDEDNDLEETSIIDTDVTVVEEPVIVEEPEIDEGEPQPETEVISEEEPQPEDETISEEPVLDVEDI